MLHGSEEPIFSFANYEDEKLVFSGLNDTDDLDTQQNNVQADDVQVSEGLESEGLIADDLKDVADFNAQQDYVPEGDQVPEGLEGEGLIADDLKDVADFNAQQDYIPEGDQVSEGLEGEGLIADDLNAKQGSVPENYVQQSEEGNEGYPVEIAKPVSVNNMEIDVVKVPIEGNVVTADNLFIDLSHGTNALAGFLNNINHYDLNKKQDIANNGQVVNTMNLSDGKGHMEIENTSNNIVDNNGHDLFSVHNMLLLGGVFGVLSSVSHYGHPCCCDGYFF
ncbi:hypothetical protein EDL79_00635 [Ehrlichia ruminantium]|uniref:Uncharacterized protein n=1 Tax=Ehrlichia ruminantium TaxID=779 RepID=A0AAE6QAD1_EHRRU|nr:hypothetical protein [Ehrlichia ruminantium]QGR03123.1 hypothetical protein EDL80_00635 [Ehrlichia ruminantium]QGR04048.1 hypothetical protein EDL79_00635 [Ehrlichia ruminantium]